MATTSIKPKVSRCQADELKDLREKLEKKDSCDPSAKSTYVNAPADKWKALTEEIDTDELEYYLDEMGADDELLDTDSLEETEELSAMEEKEAWIQSYMFGMEDVTRGVESETSESVTVPDVQQMIISNEAFSKAPWLLVEYTKEQQKVIKGLIRLKKEALEQDVTLAEAQVLKADLEYLYKCETRILKEIDTAELYYRRRLKQLEEDL
jgi:hypothetical protein